MSVDIFVFLALNRAPDFDDWQKAMRASSPEMHFVAPVDLAKHSGFLPLVVDGKTTGFFFFRNDAKELVSDYPMVAASGVSGGVAYQLSFGGDAHECIAVMRSAEVLVKNFGGVAFDPQGGKVMTTKDLDDNAALCGTSLRP
jgi:hypothetical protein